MTGGHSAVGWEADLRDMWLWSGQRQTWEPLGTYEAGPEPSERSGGEEAQAPVYDEESGQLIVLNSYGETWAFDISAGSWRRMNPTAVPASRCGQGMAYDAESDRAILFGGFGCADPNDPALAETWSFDFESGQWTEMHPPTSPSARMYFGMGYDRALDRIVLWGGRTLQPLSDEAVWLYDFNADRWESIDPDGGPDGVLAYPGMAYRPEIGDFLVFGGAALSAPFEGRLSDETWRLDLRGNRWEQLSPPHSPPAVAVHGMAYDPVRRLAVAFGGEIGEMYSNSLLTGTWTFDSQVGSWIRH